MRRGGSKRRRLGPAAVADAVARSAIHSFKRRCAAQCPKSCDYKCGKGGICEKVGRRLGSFQLPGGGRAPGASERGCWAVDVGAAAHAHAPHVPRAACVQCADGYGRVGKDCLKCKVRGSGERHRWLQAAVRVDPQSHCQPCPHPAPPACVGAQVKYCSKCGGNVNRCKVCGDNADYETLFATSDGTRCLKARGGAACGRITAACTRVQQRWSGRAWCGGLRMPRRTRPPARRLPLPQCQAHPQCTRCTSANGACTECSEGWYVSKGTCKKVKPCLVPGCKRCAADPSKCEDCAYQGEDPDECDATWEFDPRTKTCARLGGTLSPFCGGQYD